MASACYVYAIVGRGTGLPSELTADAGDLALVPWRDLAAVTGRAADIRPCLTLEAALHHEAVIEAVRELGPALPVRFGTVFNDAHSVAAALAQRYQLLSADLDRLGDKVEMSLTVLWGESTVDARPAADAAPEGASAMLGHGAHYMYTRAAEMRRTDALEERAHVVVQLLDRVFGTLALERRESRLPSAQIAVRATYLLPPPDVDAFKTAFDAVRRSLGDLRFMLTGPWPPYSFVRRGEAVRDGVPDDRISEIAHVLTDMMRGHDG